MVFSLNVSNISVTGSGVRAGPGQSTKIALKHALIDIGIQIQTLYFEVYSSTSHLVPNSGFFVMASLLVG